MLNGLGDLRDCVGPVRQRVLSSNKEQRRVAREEHVSLIKEGTEVWNQWRREKPGVRPDLYSANLKGLDCTGMDLSGAVLSVAILDGADFTEANLRQADISSANLTEAVLEQADLHGADGRGTNLSRADLRGADLGCVDLRSALLVGADLDGTDLSGANLGSTLLQKAHNLEIAQLASARTLWLAELGERLDLVRRHCPHLLERPA